VTTTSTPGQIPLEVFDAQLMIVRGNTIISGNRGITGGRNTNAQIVDNVVLNQTVYAVELGQSDNVRVAGNVARNCAAFLHQTSGTIKDVVIEANQIVGSGLSAAVTGNCAIKIPSGDYVRLHHNTFRGFTFVNPVIRVGITSTVTNFEITDNEFIFDTANTGPSALQVTQANGVKVRGNRAVFTCDLVAGDDLARVFQFSQGACSGLVVEDNEVVFRGAIAASAALSGSAPRTLPPAGCRAPICATTRWSTGRSGSAPT
jgi:hypothetical protein